MAKRHNSLNPPKRKAVICECGNHAFVALTRGFVTLTDPDDLDLLRSRSWCAVPDKRTVYAQAAIDHRIVRLHRVILQTDVLVDHINGDGADNRRANLRPATSSQNAANRRRQRPGPSGVVGVRKLRDGTYIAMMSVGRGHVSLGRYSSVEEASAARDIAMRERYGEYAASERRPIPAGKKLESRSNWPVGRKLQSRPKQARREILQSQESDT